MNHIIKGKEEQLNDICRKRRVRHLWLFGSAASDDFDPSESDLDFLVEFEPMQPVEYPACYFGLLEDIETLFGLEVDLVEAQAIKNPFFRQSVEETRVMLFEAA